MCGSVIETTWPDSVTLRGAAPSTSTVPARSDAGMRSTAGRTTITGPVTESWLFAPGELKGTIYYQSYGTKLAYNYTGALGLSVVRADHIKEANDAQLPPT